MTLPRILEASIPRFNAEPISQWHAPHPSGDGEYTDYHRSLDLPISPVTVTYRKNGIAYTEIALT